MNDFPLIIDNQHLIIICNDRRMLLDTGSPLSMGEGELIIDDISYPLKPNDTLNIINNGMLLTDPIDVLIGMDIMSKYSILFDYEAGVVNFGMQQPEMFTYSLRLNNENLMNQCFVTINVDIDGNNCRALLDTGAWCSYVNSNLIMSGEVVGELEDFNPIIGNIHTTIHRVNIRVDDKMVNTTVGKMPNILAQALNLIGVRAIIGLNLLDSSKINLDFIGNKIHFN